MTDNAATEFPPPDLVPMRAAWSRPVTFFHPTVYRYLEARFVDALLQRGELRLSSFRAFRKHKDEERGDLLEGSAMSFGVDEALNREFGIFSTIGQNAYVLCATLHPDPKLRTSLGGGCFEIINIDAFACTVANEIPGMTGVMAGFCVYRDHNITLRKGITLPPGRFNDDADPTKISMDKLAVAAAEVSGPRQYFMKHTKYRHQVEYRFIWETNKPAQDFIDVKLPVNLLAHCCRRSTV